MQIAKTDVFEKWFQSLKDRQAKRIIIARLDRVAYGLLGDVKSLGDGVSELRINYGPGYRLYCKQQGNVLIILLCGGNKSSQQEDIKKAKELAKEV